MGLKFRIWEVNHMVMPEEIAGKSIYRYLLDQGGRVFGIDMGCMKWDGNLHMKSGQIMPEIGRTDRLGRPTYDGDVVRVHTAQGIYNGVVRYSRNLAGYEIALTAGGSIPMYTRPTYEIIGHKFQEEMCNLLPEQRHD